MRVAGEASFQRAGALRSSDGAVKPSVVPIVRAGPPGFIGRLGRSPDGPGPRACRAGSGWASRLKSEVMAHSAPIDSKTMS